MRPTKVAARCAASFASNIPLSHRERGSPISHRPIGPGSAIEGIASTFSTPARTHAQAIFMTLPLRAQPAAGQLHSRQQIYVLTRLFAGLKRPNSCRMSSAVSFRRRPDVAQSRRDRQAELWMSDTHRCTGQPCQLPVLPRKCKTVSSVQRARAPFCGRRSRGVCFKQVKA